MRRETRLTKITLCALLVAMEVILSRFLSISTPIVKIGFDFAPMAVAGLLFGPLWGCAVGALADFVGANLFPIGPYFPGFTLVAGLSGLTYGLLLHRGEGGQYAARALCVRATLAALIVTIPLQLGLDTVWLSMLMGKGYLALLPSRVLKCAVMIPVQILTIHTLATLSAQIRRHTAARL